MKVLYVPQLNDRIEILYEFNGDVITAHYGEESDVFSFEGMPDGKVSEVETSLPSDVLVSAEKKNGELYVKLLRFLKLDATEAERFPEWTDVKDLKVGVYDGEN